MPDECWADGFDPEKLQDGNPTFLPEGARCSAVGASADHFFGLGWRRGFAALFSDGGRAEAGSIRAVATALPGIGPGVASTVKTRFLP